MSCLFKSCVKLSVSTDEGLSASQNVFKVTSMAVIDVTNMATRHGFLSSVILHHILVVLYLSGPLNDVQINLKGIRNIDNAINYHSMEYSGPNLLIFAAHGSSQQIHNPRRTTYLATRVMRYPNLTSTFQLCRLQVSGDKSKPRTGEMQCMLEDTCA